jgi:hypothetical protein
VRGRLNTPGSDKPAKMAEVASPPAKKFERLRGLGSFLAWVFVLDQIAAAKSLLATAPHPVDPEGIAGRDPPTDSDLKFEELAMASPPKAMPGDTIEDDGANPQHIIQSGHLLPLPDTSAPSLGLSPTASGVSGADGGARGGGGGGGANDDSPFGPAGLDLVLTADDDADGIAGLTAYAENVALGSNPFSGESASTDLVLPLPAAASLAMNLAGPGVDLCIDLGTSSVASSDQSSLNVAATLGLAPGAMQDQFLDLDARLALAGGSLGSGSDDIFSLRDGTVAEIGLQLPGEEASLTTRISAPSHDVGSGSSDIVSLLDSTVAAEIGLQIPGEETNLTTRISAPSDPVPILGSEAPQPAALVLHEAPELMGLSQNGDASSGGSIIFPAQKASAPGADAEPYNEYQLTLQSQHPELTNRLDPVKNVVIEHAETTSSAADMPGEKPHKAAVTPISDHSDAALTDVSLSVHHLTGH